MTIERTGRRAIGRTRMRALAAAAIAGFLLSAGASLPAYGSSPAEAENGKIAFSGQATASDPRDIFTMNPDGSERVNITNHPARDQQPDWSPDGSRLVFSTNRDGNFELYAMDGDGTDLQRLTNHPAADIYPNWSPDGTKIAFARNQGGNSQIRVMNADGSGVTPPLTDFPGSGAERPDWSPDGRRIAYEATPTGGIFNDVAIFTMQSDGSDQRQLTPIEMNAGDPEYSPDGKLIVFPNNFCACPFASDIHVMRANGTQVRQLTQNFGNNQHPTWSADGETIAFVHRDDFPPVGDDIVLLELVGGTLTNITNTPDFREMLIDWQALPDLD